MADVFLWYNGAADADAARDLGHILRGWEIDTALAEDVPAGTDMAEWIARQIEDAGVVVVLLSHAVKEVGMPAGDLISFLVGKKVLVPVLLDNEATQNFIWPLVADRQGIDLTQGRTIDEAAEVIAKVVHSSTTSPDDDWGIGRSRVMQKITKAG